MLAAGQDKENSLKIRVRCNQQRYSIAEKWHSQQAWHDLFDIEWVLQYVTSLACPCTILDNQQTDSDTSAYLRDNQTQGQIAEMPEHDMALGPGVIAQGSRQGCQASS